MSGIIWIARRELAAYLRSPLGYIIISASLALAGLLFNGFCIGENRRSNEVLGLFFYCMSGVIVTAAVFIAMRLIAEEKQTGSLTLLATSPLRDGQIVVGKFVGGFLFLTLLTALTIYMPVLVMTQGKISFGHLAAGYLGLLLIGGAALGLGLLCSALSPNQLVAAVLGAGVVVVFIILWWISKIASPPLNDVISYLSIHNKHFTPFMRGLISIQDVVFYISLTYVSLVVTTRVLEARRWR